MQVQDVVVVGGGSAGFFGAIRVGELAKMQGASVKVLLIERSEKLLSKVLVSGGGRCNVTHACFDPAQLCTYYPRGGKAMRGPFNRFQPRDTIDWFKDHGVELKTEKDGRMFPVSNKSKTIADSLLHAASMAGVEVQTGVSLQSFRRNVEGQPGLRLECFHHSEARSFSILTKTVLFATGGTTGIQKILSEAGITVTRTVPSLFTFVIEDERLKDIPGLSVPMAAVNFSSQSYGHTTPQQIGPILVTHWGLSGPAILRLSGWGAYRLAESGYRDAIKVNWLHPKSADEVFDVMQKLRSDSTFGKRIAVANPAFSQIAGRMWRKFVLGAMIAETARWTDIPNRSLRNLAEHLTGMELAISGKGVYKDEFVTAGGVDLAQIDLRTMESKQLPGVYFAGELLDVDGVTGGFNFQNAWTTGWIAGGGMFERISADN